MSEGLYVLPLTFFHSFCHQESNHLDGRSATRQQDIMVGPRCSTNYWLRRFTHWGQKVRKL